MQYRLEMVQYFAEPYTSTHTFWGWSRSVRHGQEVGTGQVTGAGGGHHVSIASSARSMVPCLGRSGAELAGPFW